MWLWDAVFAPERKSYAFEVTALATTTLEPARVVIWLQGGSDLEAAPDHHVRVYVNDHLVGDVRWDGKRSQKVEADVTSLQNGANALEIENVGDTDATYSMVMLNRFSIRYPRGLVAVNGRLEGDFDASGLADVSGLSSASVVDVTGEPRWLGSAKSMPFRAEAGSKISRRRARGDPLAIDHPRRPGQAQDAPASRRVPRDRAGVVPRDREATAPAPPSARTTRQRRLSGRRLFGVRFRGAATRNDTRLRRLRLPSVARGSFDTCCFSAMAPSTSKLSGDGRREPRAAVHRKNELPVDCVRSRVRGRGGHDLFFRTLLSGDSQRQPRVSSVR